MRTAPEAGVLPDMDPLPRWAWVLPGVVGLGWGLVAGAEDHPWAEWCMVALIGLALLRWLPQGYGVLPFRLRRTVCCVQALFVGLITVAALDALHPDLHHWPILGLFLCGTLCGYALAPALCCVLPVLVDLGWDVTRFGNTSTLALLLTLLLWWWALLWKRQQDTKPLGGSVPAVPATSRGAAELLKLFGHDLQQPLMALRWYAQTLRRQTLSGEGQRALASLDACADAAQTMVRDLLRLERLKAQVDEASSALPAPACFGVLMEGILLELRPLAESRGIRLVCRGAEWPVPAQALLLEHALRNVIGNAVAATQTGGVLVALQPRRAGWRLRVVDTGPGMPQRLSSTLALEGASASARPGLGWALIRQTCCAMGAAVVVVSRPGRGTCVSISFPQAEPTLETAAPKWSPRSSARSDHPGS